jgi:hypothetical protein
MKVTASKNGKTKITLSKKEWEQIGRKASWFKDDSAKIAPKKVDNTLDTEPRESHRSSDSTSDVINKGKRYLFEGKESLVGYIINTILKVKTLEELYELKDRNPKVIETNKDINNAFKSKLKSLQLVKRTSP